MIKEIRIKKLRKSLEELYKIYAQDIKASHHEPGQTLQMIQLYEKQLLELEAVPEASGREVKIELKSDTGERRDMTVIEGSPDPFNGVISSDSEIGKLLLKAKKGDKLKIGDTGYTLVSKK